MEPSPAQRLRIVHVVDTLEIGGAERLVALIGRLQKQAGHEVRVVCLFSLGPLAEELRGLGIPVELVGPGRIWRLMPALVRCFRRLRPQVVHCHNATPGIMASIPARMAGVRVVLDTRHGLVPPPYNVVRERKFWTAARWMNAVVAVCDATRRNLENAPGGAPGKVVRIYHGTEPPAGGELPEPSAGGVGFRLVHVARLAPAKDQATLLRAVALAAREVPDLSLSIVGGGPLESALRALAGDLGIAERVRFHGEQAAVGRYLQAADVFVLSSNTEGFPISILEAMAWKLPVLATTVGGIPEVVTPDIGVVVPPADPAALANAIVELSRRRAELPAMGDLAQRRYRETFSPARTVQAYEELYRRYL